MQKSIIGANSTIGEVEESGGVGTGILSFIFFVNSKSQIIGGGLIDNLVGWLLATVIGNECGISLYCVLLEYKKKVVKKKSRKKKREKKNKKERFKWKEEERERESLNHKIDFHSSFYELGPTDFKK